MAKPQRRDGTQVTRDGASTQVVGGDAMVSADIPLLYNYDLIPEGERAGIQQTTKSIKVRLKRTARDIFNTGADFLRVKEVLQHGQFVDWLDAEFDLTPRTAQNWMNVANRLADKSEKFLSMAPSALYLLAAPSTPDEAIADVEKKIDSGAKVNLPTTKATIKRYMPDSTPPPSSPPPPPRERAEASTVTPSRPIGIGISPPSPERQTDMASRLGEMEKAIVSEGEFVPLALVKKWISYVRNGGEMPRGFHG